MDLMLIANEWLDNHLQSGISRILCKIDPVNCDFRFIYFLISK